MIKQVGTYTHYEQCRSCLSKDMVSFLNLGYVPLAGGFLNSQKEFAKELYYPLELCFCRNCFLVQTNNVINKDTLFKNYFYHTSAIKTLTDHFVEIAEMLKSSYINKKSPFVVEIGCNDGAFLKVLKQKDIQALGVDPAINIVGPLKEKFSIINDYFTQKVASNIKNKYGEADVIFSSNTLAHIESIHDVFEGIKLLLKPDGILIFEVHYLDSVLDGLQYDMIYHEHQYYFSLISLQNLLKKHDLIIYDIEQILIHAGSMRYFVQLRTGKRKISKKVEERINSEMKKKYNKVETYLNYGKKILQTKKDLFEVVKKIKKNHKSIAGYGASGRSTVMMNFCQLDSTILDYIIHDSPAKQNTYTPGMHVKIVSNEMLYIKKPDYVLLFAWSFRDEILSKITKFIKNGGKILIPLPKVIIEDGKAK